MKKFRFSLEALRMARRRAEESKKREYGAALHRANEAAADLSATETRSAGLMKELRDTMGKNLDIRAVLLGLNYKRHLEHTRDEQKEALAYRSAEAEVKRTSLIEAFKRKKVVDRLKEKKLSNWRQAGEREEQKIIDEVAGVTGLARKRSEKL